MNKLVVVVDDSKIVLTCMKSYIEGNGDTCIAFRNPVEAVRHIKSIDPDIIITDYLMFDMDGLELYDALREQGVSCPIVVFTSILDYCMEKQCKERNIPLYYKPVDREVVRQMVEEN